MDWSENKINSVVHTASTKSSGAKSLIHEIKNLTYAIEEQTEEMTKVDTEETARSKSPYLADRLGLTRRMFHNSGRENEWHTSEVATDSERNKYVSDVSDDVIVALFKQEILNREPPEITALEERHKQIKNLNIRKLNIF